MNISQRDINEIIKDMGTDKTIGYGKMSLPCSFDEDISKMVNSFIKMSLQERDVFLEKFTRIRQSDTLLAFSERMAILSVREKNPRWIFEGLIAQVIEDLRQDWRENTMILSLLDHSAKKIGADPMELFKKAVDYASPKTAKFLIDFAERDPNLKSIEMMGYYEVMREGGFWYERNW
ncbi:MAG: hypothetical protein ABII74_10030 [Elusimicrobiota bacterium]